MHILWTKSAGEMLREIEDRPTRDALIDAARRIARLEYDPAARRKRRARPLQGEFADLVSVPSRDGLRIVYRPAQGPDDPLVIVAVHERRENGDTDIHSLAKRLVNLGLLDACADSAAERPDSMRSLLSYYEEHLPDETGDLGASGPMLIKDLNNLGRGWEHQGDFAKAAGYYDKALKLAASLYAPDNATYKLIADNARRVDGLLKAGA